MLAAMFSATMANLSAQFNVKSAILTKDVYQSLFRKSAGEHELLVVGWITTFLIGGATTAIAVIMAASGQSVFQIMLTFNTLMSLAYGPPALLGLVVRRTPPWSGLASFATGLILGMLGAFVYHWSLIQQVAIIIPASFGVFFLTMLFDRGDTPGRALLFKNLNTPVDVATELKDSADFTAARIPFSEPHDFVHWIVEPGVALHRAAKSADDGGLVCWAHGCGGRVSVVRARERRTRETSA